MLAEEKEPAHDRGGNAGANPEHPETRGRPEAFPMAVHPRGDGSQTEFEPVEDHSDVAGFGGKECPCDAKKKTKKARAAP